MLWERIWDARDEILSLLLLGFGLVRLGMMAVSLVRHGHIGLGKRGLRARGVRHNNQGLKALRQADWAAALAQFQQAAGLLHEAGDRRGEGLALSNASLMCEYLGAYRQMIAHAEQALAVLGPRARTVQVDAWWSLGRAHGRLDEWDAALASYGQALALATRRRDRATRLRVLNDLAALYARMGRHDDRLSTYQQVLGLAHDLRDRSREAQALNLMGEAYEDAQRHDEAMESHRRALAVFRQAGDRSGEMITLNRIGELGQARGRRGEAAEAFHAARQLSEELGDRGKGGTAGKKRTLADPGLAGKSIEPEQSYKDLAMAREAGDERSQMRLWRRVGSMYAGERQFADALECYQRALASARQIGDREAERLLQERVAGILQRLGEYDAALAIYEQDLAQARQEGDPLGEIGALLDSGQLYLTQERYAEALENLSLALEMAYDEDYLFDHEPEMLNGIGLAHQHLGRPAEALASFQEALAAHRDQEDEDGASETWSYIAALHLRQGRPAEAAESMAQALAAARAGVSPHSEGRVFANIGRMHRGQGQWEAAQAAYEQALAIARQGNDGLGEAGALAGLGGVCRGRGQAAEALTYHQQALDIAQAMGRPDLEREIRADMAEATG